MKVTDSRRLTGPNLQSCAAGAIVEVSFEQQDSADALIADWRKRMGQIAELLPFSIGALKVRRYRGGAAFFVEAPIDALYATTEANEWAVETVISESRGDQAPDLSAAVSKIEETYSGEVSPLMMRLIAEANARGIPVLWDDDDFSIGYGCYSKTFSRSKLPTPDDVPWTALDSIPVVLVTGTNGKTTTARILSRILQVSGRTVGNSSTDGIQLNGVFLDEGDWTGPGAARMILRHPEIDAAVLETARGGLLRRGVGVNACDAAIVTNVADDHLGEYGIFDLTDLAMTKGLVYSVVKEDGVRVINMDDAHASALAGLHDTRAIWTFQHTPAEWSSHRASGGWAVHVEHGRFCLSRGDETQDLIAVDDVPLARGGTAKYDISNVLAAIALAIGIGVESTAIKIALQQFGRSWQDNPGRGQSTIINGVHILMDFAHNAHGVTAVLDRVTSQLGADGRLSVSVSQAGDRSIDDIRQMVSAIVKAKPDRIYLRDLPERYRRGRTPDETRAIFTQFFLEFGVSADAIHPARHEVHSLNQALSWAKEGDHILHMVHLERDAVFDRLTTLGADVS
ncbi:MAG: Mur ligase family protein [Myxococcota bacterium]|nr:Mur ligase family protein [Myxococcota bacterium]